MLSLSKLNPNKRLVSVKALTLYAKCMVVSCMLLIQLIHYCTFLIRLYVNGAATHLDFTKCQREIKFTDYLSIIQTKVQ